MAAETLAMSPTPAPDQFVRDLWYMPALASSLKRGQMRREMLLGEPVLLGRDHAGQLFALRDICPHRGVPLSAGRIKSDQTVECPYHGWRFRQDGVCGAIPSLVPGQDFDPEKIRCSPPPSLSSLTRHKISQPALPKNSPPSWAKLRRAQRC